MTTLLRTPSDLERYARSRPGGRRTGSLDAPDPWLDTAAALRNAALDLPGVAALSESAAFQTRGRGPAVSGVALAPLLGGGVRADVAVVVDAEAGSPAAVGRAVGQALRALWERTRDEAEFTVRVHVVDLDQSL